MIVWNQKIHKYVEIKQNTPEQPMDQKRNHKLNKTISYKQKWKHQYTKTYGTQQKQPWEGSL